MQALEAWNMMGGINWTALPIVAEYIGIDDIDRLLDLLTILREHHDRRR